MTQTWKFVRTKKHDCSGCGNSTVGALEDEAGKQIACCPRCRDTHSVYERLTGQNFTIALSEFSGQIECKIPTADQIPPMLARALKDAKPAALVGLAKTSREWMAAEKYDGVRAVLYVVESGLVFLGRNHTQGTGQYNDLTDNVRHLQVKADSLAGTVLDGELLFRGDRLDTGSVVTDSMLSATCALLNCEPDKSQALQAKHGRLVYVVFDCMRFKGQDVRDLPLSERLKYTAIAYAELKMQLGDYVELERHTNGTPAEKEALYQQVVADGGEGVMYKDLKASYSRNPTSRPSSWLKRKKRYTTDAFVTGYIPGEAGFTGLVGALILSVRDGAHNVEIAACSNMELSFRRKISLSDGTLDPQWYGKVFEVSFQERSARVGRGRHAVIEHERPDKSNVQCTLEDMRLS